MDIDALAKEKVELQLRLQAINMTNVYSATVDDRVALEMDRIKTQRRLNEIEREIMDYETARVYRNDAIHP